MITNPTLPYGFAIFCDDVRNEINGKTTFVGTYSQKLFFHGAPPAGLPLLSVCTWYRFAPTEVPLSLEFRLVYEAVSGEETLLQSVIIELPEEKPEIAPLKVSDEHAQRYLELRHIAQLRDVHFTEPGRLKVRVYDGDREVRIGTLHVEFVEPVEAQDAPQASI